MFLPMMLIFYSVLLFDFLNVEIMEFLKSMLYWCLLNLYMLLVLYANVIVLSDILIIFISCWRFFWKWFFTFLNFEFFSKEPFLNGTSSSTFPGHFVELTPYHSVWSFLPFPWLKQIAFHRTCLITRSIKTSWVQS